MIQVEITFNGNAELRLFPQTEDDHKALDLLLNNKQVLEVTRPVKDSEQRECCRIVFGQPIPQLAKRAVTTGE